MTDTPVQAAPVPAPRPFDPMNYIIVLVHICDTFGLSHQQMMDLRARVEKTYHAQPIAFSRKGKAPVTLNAVALVYGLAIGFGGYDAALKVSPDLVIQAGRDIDPFNELSSDTLRRMQQLSKHDRKGRRRF
jgi:hypothetical protein